MRNARELFARNSNSTTLGCLVFFFLSFVRSFGGAGESKGRRRKKKREAIIKCKWAVCVLCCVVCAFPKRREFEGGGRWELGALRRSGHEWTMMMMMMNNQAIKIYQYVRNIYLNEREKKQEEEEKDSPMEGRRRRRREWAPHGHRTIEEKPKYTEDQKRVRNQSIGITLKGVSLSLSSMLLPMLLPMLLCVFAFQNGRDTTAGAKKSKKNSKRWTRRRRRRLGRISHPLYTGAFICIMFSTFLCVCVCVSWLKRVEEKRKENSSINQLPNEEASNAMRHNSTHTHKKKRYTPIKLFAVVFFFYILVRNNNNNNVTQEWNQKFPPFFFFVSKQKNVEIVSVIKSHPSNHFSPFGQTFGSDLFSFNYFYFFVFFLLFQAVKKVFVELIDSTERYWGVFNCNTFFFFLLVGARLISMNKNWFFFFFFFKEKKRDEIDIISHSVQVNSFPSASVEFAFSGLCFGTRQQELNSAFTWHRVEPLRPAPFSHPLFKTAHHHHHRWLFNHYFFFFFFSYHIPKHFRICFCVFVF
jgi:hypothetical protein